MYVVYILEEAKNYIEKLYGTTEGICARKVKDAVDKLVPKLRG